MNPEAVKTLARHMNFTEDPNGRLLMELVVATMKQNENFTGLWDSEDQVDLCYAACVLMLCEEEGWKLTKDDDGTESNVQSVQAGDESAGSDLAWSPERAERVP